MGKKSGGSLAKALSKEREASDPSSPNVSEEAILSVFEQMEQEVGDVSSEKEETDQSSPFLASKETDEEIIASGDDVQNEDDVGEYRKRVGRIYPKESIAIAEHWVDNIHSVLLGDNFFLFQFTEKHTGTSGFEFALRSLTSEEDAEVRGASVMNGWSSSPSNDALQLTLLEQLKYSLYSFKDKNFRGASLQDKDSFIGALPSFVRNRMIEQLQFFNMALDLASRGRGEFDLVKKYSALQPTFP